VPFLAGDVLGFLVGLDDQDLRMLPAARRGRMQVQLAEAAAERLVLLVARACGRGRRSPGSPSARVMDFLKAWLPNGLARSTPKISAPMQGELAHPIVW
jgi:hypothetical protein